MTTNYMVRTFAIVFGFALAGCWGLSREEAGDRVSDIDADTDTDSDGGTHSDADGDTDTDTGTGTDTGTDTDTDTDTNIDPSGGCQPICGTDECGDDGCGGECGLCNNDSHCREGECVLNACDPCYVPADSSSRCTWYPACTVTADCPAEFNIDYTCDAGRCIADWKRCQTHADCLQMCEETYGQGADVCGITNVPTCIPNECNPAWNTCALPAACTTPADCSRLYGYDHVCEDGRCQMQVKNCTTDSFCQSECLDAYGATSELCGTTKIPTCLRDECDDSKGMCTLQTPCLVKSDCPTNVYSVEYDCIDGVCESSSTTCASDQDCQEQCDAVYQETWPEVCTELYRPSCYQAP